MYYSVVKYKQNEKNERMKGNGKKDEIQYNYKDGAKSRNRLHT